ncbi:MAG: hypothetical protein AUG51_02390 [Acidobacteria bacterium 13_1_20CM_3_53_8]|nr:MAG: hypothetical protein AUG51_02390 [Acidobacteria bacterium 13_1_20CM_3_53_8]
MIWINLGIALLNVSLLIGIITVLFPGSAAWTRTTALAAIKLGGIVLVTVVLVHLASDALSSIAAAPTPLTGPGPVPETGVPRVSYAQPSTSDLAIVVFSAMFRSLLLVLVAVVWGALVGLGSAYLVQLRRTSGFLTRRLRARGASPDIQPDRLTYQRRLRHSVCGPSLLGWRGSRNPPSSDAYRQARLALQSEAAADHVRTALANGLPWRTVAARHIFRPAAASLATVWLNSFRVMLGALPLVEFFFGYPGLGQQLVLALGVSYPDQVGLFQPNLAIPFVIGLAVLVVVCEASVQMARQRLDIRLADSAMVAA